MTSSTEKQIEQAARTAVFNFGFGVNGYRPTVPVREGEPLTLSNGHRTLMVETRVLDVTGWEQER